MMKIFIVDDNKPFRLAMKAKLNKVPGFSVVGEADDGFEAMERVFDLKPEVVLMDIEMPFVDGVEATRRIKKRLPATRVIMLTVCHNDRRVFNALAAGADGYCLKNAEIKRIELAIRTVADGAAWLDPGVRMAVLKEAGKSGTRKSESNAESESRTPNSVPLSAREMDVLKLVADGLTNPQIAEKLSLQRETVKTHVRRIMDKLGVDDRTQAAVKMLRQGLI